MSYDDDIREIFRRAFEQQQGQGGRPEPENGSPPPPQRPTPQIPTLPDGWWKSRLLWIGGILFGLFLSFGWLTRTWTDWLWFRNVGYENVWLTQWGAQMITFLAFFVVALAFLLLNARFATKGAIATSSGFQPAAFRGFKWLLRLGSAFLAFMFASGAAAYSQQLLRFIYQVRADVADPIFGRPISFYFFNLPVFQFVRGWFLPLIVLTIIGVVGIYVLHNIEEMRTGQWRPQNITPLRRHVALLAGLAALLVAVGHVLTRFSLLFGRTSDSVNGIGFTDDNITSTVYLMLAILMALFALVLFLSAQKLRIRPLVILGAAWVLTAVLGLGVVPGIVQSAIVNPNELDRESLYIAHDIEYTRRAYGLDGIGIQDFGGVEELSAEALADNDGALKNIRLWDYRVLPKNYEQLQSLRGYYQFGDDIDIDRYTVDGETRQVMLSAREIDQNQLPDGADTWVNRKLEFTHGYGIVMNPVDRFTSDGQPEFWIRDIPVVSEYDNLALTIPQIYYGETMDNVVYAGSNREEIDYLGGTGNILRSSYGGEGGVPVGNFLRRIALAARFGDVNLILSNDVTPDTRVMYFRTISERIERITPFLQIDYDPYLVVHDGRLVWIADAYTTSAFYPYSEPSELAYDNAVIGSRISPDTNYIRNAAKITVDAYDGTVNYYLTDTDDPLIATYAKIYPNLLNKTVENDMPEGLKAHLRYPETLFRIQSQKYLKYHMDDVATFYSKGDVWAIPDEKFTNEQTRPMEPYYVIFRLPGETEPEYLLIQPYTPDERPNMVAWIAARNDAPNLGELIVYEWEDQSVLGPENIEVRIDQDPEISSQISLWNQSGSRVTRGNLIVVPLNNSFLYVEPLYIESSAADSALPELKRVIVASESNVVMRNTLSEALAALVDADSSDLVLEIPTITDTISGTVDIPTIAVDASVQSLIQSANDAFVAAEAAQQAGDWAMYGEQLALLEQILQQLATTTQP